MSEPSKEALEVAKKVQSLVWFDEASDDGGASQAALAIDALCAERVAKLIAERDRLREALIWCSGSPSFQVGGEAREGWERVCAPLIRAELKEVPDGK